ncbi:MAG: hypothetical protein R2795_06390 [Saprospiraceae bacterium]
MMARFTLFLFSIFLAAILLGQPETGFHGFIITKNNYELTGSISLLQHTEQGSMVEYINDFGTPYFLHPSLIKGFVFYEGPQPYVYKSVAWKDKWLFLRVRYSGEHVRLLQTPEILTNYFLVNDRLVANTQKIFEFWVEDSNGRITPLQKNNFRKRMKQIMADSAPVLASKIGQKGYRFKDLLQIMDAYDKELAKGKWHL